MYPEDRVLVGAITRKSDLKILLEQHWYRIPQGRAPNGIDADYLAFFTKATVSGSFGAIFYYAERRGVELARRKDLLPGKKPHKRDEELYYKIQLGSILPKEPPIRNTDKRSFAFIYTTGDRFQRATSIKDLYSKADYFVDRIFHVLKEKGYQPQRQWEKLPPTTKADKAEIIYPTYAQVRMIADRGQVIATTDPDEKPSSERETVLYLRPSLSEDEAKASAHAILEAVERLGGAKMLKLPIELS